MEMSEGYAAYTNPTLGKRFTLTYSRQTLGEFIVWKSMASGDYALGLEPTTTKLDGGFRFLTLGAGEEKHFSLKLSMENV